MSASPGQPATSEPVASTPPRGVRPSVGAELDLRIDALAHGGAGIARRDGYVVFVGGAIPGDRVRAVMTKRKRSWGEARAVEVLEASPERIDARADHPGAPWQVMPYERQLAVKAQQVAEALSRLGAHPDFDPEPIVAAEQQWRYRNKLEYSFGTDDSGELVCGFHEPGRWDRVVGLDDCLLASEASNDARRTVLDFCRRRGLRAHDRRSGAGELRNLIVREGRRSGQLQVRLVTGPAQVDLDGLAAALGERTALFWTRTDARAEVTAGGQTERVSGPQQLEERLAGLTLGISPEAFFQTNTEMAERLYAIVAEYAGLQGWERLFDLYCGIGTIGLTLAARVGELWGLEAVGASVGDAVANARRNEIEGARFETGDVRVALRDLVARCGRPDVVVMDPPRAGLSAKVVRRVIEAAPRRIVYVSCNPTTLAPNVAQLAQAGWILRRLRPIDMFPHTPHIECVALLERGAES